MAKKPYIDILATDHVNRMMTVIEGSFAPNSTFDATKNKGHGFSIAYNGVGDYTLTLNEKFAELIMADIDLQLHAAADAYAEFGDISLSAKTFVIRIVKISDGVTAVNPTSNANTRVNFTLKLKKNLIK